MLRAALTEDPPPFVVAYVHGPGGVGKSRLLRATIEAAGPDVRSVSLDCAQIEPTPRGFLRALSTGLDDHVSEPDAQAVARILGAGRSRTLLLLDTYETFGLMDAWLRNTFLPLLPETVMTLIAGRSAPSPAWLTTPGWERLFREVALGSLSPQESREMLLRRGLSDEEAGRVQRFAHGHPLALELGAAALRAQPDLKIAGGPPPRILEQLSAAFLSGLPEDVAQAAEAASTVRRITQPMLTALLDASPSPTLLDGLRDLPFVKPTVEGLAFHDLVRDTIAADLARRDPDRHRLYRRRAWGFLTGQSHATAALNLWQHTADLLFLFQNPYVREAFFPAGSSEVSIEQAAAPDGAGILQIVAEVAPEEFGVLGSWWEHQPGAFYVARDSSGDVVGFHVLSDSRGIERGVVDADPVTRAWLDHLERDPVGERERVLFFRRWLTRLVGEGPSAAQAACWLDVKRTYMELRPNLRRLYTAVRDLSPYAPTLVPLGFAPLAEADVAVGGVMLHTGVLDFGDSSVNGWLRGLIGAELGADLDALERESPTLPEGTVTIMFTDIADSTALTEQLGDGRFRDLARQLDTAIRVVISETGGVPVEGLLLGDGLMAVFTSAHQAIEGGVRARAAARDVGLGLHLGLHAGDVIREGNNVFGGAVNLAARVAATARPGEILVSETVRGLARTSASTSFEDRGTHALKGVAQAQRLYAIGDTMPPVHVAPRGA